MSQQREEKERAEFLAGAAEMYEELRRWREKHPAATIDEIGSQITPRRRELMGQLLQQLATQQGDGTVIEGMVCRECGAEMVYKGKPKRELEHLEGETELMRAYYYCDGCEAGLFPPG
jgi:uncharacterized protein with PIN domain